MKRKAEEEEEAAEEQDLAELRRAARLKEQRPGTTPLLLLLFGYREAPLPNAPNTNPLIYSALTYFLPRAKLVLSGHREVTISRTSRPFVAEGQSTRERDSSCREPVRDSYRVGACVHFFSAASRGKEKMTRKEIKNCGN